MIHAVLAAAALAFQVVTVQHDTGVKKKEKGNTEVSIGFGARRGRDTLPPRRIPVTAEHLRTAFADPLARELLTRVREARRAQDSAIVAYDAMAYQRISAGMGFSKIGRDRLIFRQESASHVRWRRNVGAWIELTGARVAIPIAPDDAKEEANEENNENINDAMDVLPYYPGYEPLIALDRHEVAQTQVDERQIVHPLVEGAEAYYTYATGDSISFKLPDGFVVRLRELRVRPREPKWNVVVGSLWFDVASGQLVRAAYRLATPLDVWVIAKQEDPHAMDDVPIWVKPLISPIRAQVNAITVEYGLYNGRFWLPRNRSADGSADVSFMHLPFRMEQRFTYASVNGTDSLPAIHVAQQSIDRDTLTDEQADHIRDSVRAARHAERDSIRAGTKQRVRSGCDTSAFTTQTMTRFGDARVPIAYQVPCDRSKLASSPDLPPSIYDPGEDVFGSADRDALVAQVMSLTAQPHFGPQPPTLRWGTELMRYNRVEGFSAGAALDEQFGAGYSATLLGRIGTGDWRPNLEATFARSNEIKNIHVTGYTHLVAANDWGRPLSFGSSLSALLFGRDEGFYYRATGAELGGSVDAAGHVEWRIFSEAQRNAPVETDFSLGHGLGRPNLTAWRATYSGVGLRMTGSHGLDPRGFRVLGALNLEAATSPDSGYGRGAGELTLSQGFGPRLATALTLSTGSSLGELPPQRRWYLGGTQTIRGQWADTAQSGNAYWMTRTDVGLEYGAARPGVFADFGWVGDRDRWRDVGRPLAGVGVGSSFMDGLIRADIARGIYPAKRWRLDLSVEARF